MTDGIGRIFGGNSYSVNGYVSRKNEDSKKDASEESLVQNQHEEIKVDPSKVMEFLASNNLFVAPVENAKVEEIDLATQERVASYMENFEMIYDVIVEEFGEKIAPDVMDIAMDYLIGLAA